MGYGDDISSNIWFINNIWYFSFNNLLITKLFLKVYEHKKIIYQLINHKLKNPFSKLQKIKKKRKYTYFQLVFELNKNLMECSNEN